MFALEPNLCAILHHSVSCKRLRLDISSATVSDAIWTETLGLSEGQLEQLRVLGNWALYSSLVHHTLSAIPAKGRHGDTFFQIMNRSVLHPNIYTQLFIKTGVYAAEDPLTVAEDQVSADAFVLLCAMLMRSNGPESFLSWFGTHFGGLLVLSEQVYTIYMTHGGKYLAEQQARCFPSPAVECRLNIPHVGLPNGPPILKSLALLRILKDRLSPSLISLQHRLLPCAPPIPPTTSAPYAKSTTTSVPRAQPIPAASVASISPKTAVLQTPLLPSPALFASVSTLEKEYSLRCELVSRKQPNSNNECTMKHGITALF
ncbi:hypothetical protein C8F04DRAFT_1367346 [Mycena alexandri]|uniref:Uncharacterized protein n=1 Tax=Mycena alexandri TaxID=1745969 RepID=A0AAD6SNT0_9AGAR|nr:hypothetical protein C8F04DRAFT_1367346 [Mycena alexandri]